MQVTVMHGAVLTRQAECLNHRNWDGQAIFLRVPVLGTTEPGPCGPKGSCLKPSQPKKAANNMARTRFVAASKGMETFAPFAMPGKSVRFGHRSPSDYAVGWGTIHAVSAPGNAAVEDTVSEGNWADCRKPATE